MSRNLFDFSSEKIKGNEQLHKSKLEEKVDTSKLENIDQSTLNEASNLYDKYKNYSTEELTSEFVNLSKKRLKDGSLTKEKLNSTLSSLSSVLSPQQKQFFESLLGELDD